MATDDGSPQEGDLGPHRMSDDLAQPSVNEEHRVPVPDGGWGWVVVLATFVVHVIADGVAYTFGVLVPPLIEQFDAGRGELGGVGSVMVGVTWISGPLVSVINNRFGCRTTTILGTVMAAIGFVISAFAPNVPFLYFSFGIVAGLGLGLMYLPSIVAVNMYFDRRRGIANGLAICGAGIGTVAFAPLAVLLLAQYGWRGTVIIEAGLMLNCCACGLIYRPLPSSPSSRRRHQSMCNGAGEEDVTGWLIDREVIITKVEESASCYAALPSTEKEHADNAEVPISDEARTEHDCPVVGEISQRCIDDFFTSKEDAFDKQQQLTSDKTEACSQSSAMERDTCVAASSEHVHRVDGQQRDSRCLEDEVKVPDKQETDTAQQLEHFPAQRETHETSSCAPYFDVSLLKDPVFIAFAVSGILSCVGYSAPYVFLPDLAQVQAGLEDDKSALLISTVGLSNLVARVVFGFVADSACVNRLVLYGAAIVVGGLACTTVVFCTGFLLLMAFAAVFGACIGIFTLVVPLVLIDLFGASRLSDTFGVMLCCNGIGTAVGTPIVGWLFDRYRSYGLAFLVAGLTTIVSGLMLFALPFLQRCKQRRHHQPALQTVTEPLA